MNLNIFGFTEKTWLCDQTILI